MTTQRYLTLDGMRGVAALLVALYHFQSRTGNSVLAGYLAVDLFFMMSGFVISASYGAKMGKELDFIAFSRLRLIRLLPLYYIGLLLGLSKQLAGMVLGQRGIPSGELTCDVLFGAVVLPTPCSDEFFPINGPAWSLFFELLASAAFAAVLWRMKSIWLAVLAGCGAIALIMVVHPPLFFNVGWGWDTAMGGFARTIYSFCAGMLVHRWFKPEWRRDSWLCLVPLAVAVAAIWKIPTGLPQAAVEQVLVVAVFPAVLALGCLWGPPAILRKPFDVLGEISYPAYAIHWTIVTMVLLVADRVHVDRDRAAVAFVLLLLPSAFGAGMLDRAIRKLLRRPARMAPLTG